MQKAVLLFVFWVIAVLSLRAQSTGTLTGTLQDTSGKRLALATITVFTAKDTSIITYRLSDPNGLFKVSGIPFNLPARAVITFSGFKIYRREFTLTPERPSLQLGVIKMEPETRDLAEVMILAERPPVIVKKDTIEFNAASFATLPTALVEDLLKKLPGVQLDEEGNIQVNGRRVNRIMVDGKEFFGSDPKLATRNLPANIIDKVQVTDDREELELNPDASKGTIGQVINLKLKKAVKQGWFGKAYAGGGSDQRYEAGALVNLFRDTFQVSLLGYANNLNRAAFGYADLQSLGGFNRSGINSVNVSDNGGITINNISFGGSGRGIQRSGGGGFNLNTELKGGLTLNGQYFYGQTRNDVSEQYLRQQFLGDTILLTETGRTALQKGESHRIGGVLKWKISPLSRLEFRPGVALTTQRTDDLITITNTSSLKGSINASDNDGRLRATNKSYSHSLLFFKNYRKAGRTLNMTNTFTTGTLDNNQANTVYNTFYTFSPAFQSLTDQQRARTQDNISTTLSANYTEPLGGQWALRAGYNLSYGDGNDNLLTFDRNPLTSQLELVNSTLSNFLSRKSLRNNLSAGLNWKGKALNVTATVNYLAYDIENEFRKGSPKVEQHFGYVFPGLTLNYKALNINYVVSATPPSITDLQPVPDNTNPLFVVQGNPLLKPSVNHSITAQYFKNIPGKGLTANLFVNASFGENAIIRNRSIDANGVQVSTPINTSGVRDLGTSLNLSKQYKLQKNFQLTLSSNLSYSTGRGYVAVNGRKSFVDKDDIFPTLSMRLNWKDLVELYLSADKSFSHSNYEDPALRDIDVTYVRSYDAVTLRWPKHFVWDMALSYRFNSDVGPGMRKTNALVTGGLTYLFLPAEKGQLRLSVFDLLDQNVSLSRFAIENYITDWQVNVLRRYLLLTFTYNIRDFKSAKPGPRDQMFRF